MYLNVKIGECNGVTALLYSVKVVEQVTHIHFTQEGGGKKGKLTFSCFTLLYQEEITVPLNLGWM